MDRSGSTSSSSIAKGRCRSTLRSRRTTGGAEVNAGASPRVEADVRLRPNRADRNRAKGTHLYLRHSLVVTAIACCAALGSAASEGAVVVDVQVAPPPPRVVVVPPPRAGYVWAAGYWRWNGARYVWVDGHWVRER